MNLSKLVFKQTYQSLFLSKFYCLTNKQITVCTKVTLVPKFNEYSEDVFWAFFLIFQNLGVTDRNLVHPQNKKFNGICFNFIKTKLFIFLDQQSIDILPHAFSNLKSKIDINPLFVVYEISNFSNYFLLHNLMDNEIPERLDFIMLFYFKSTSGLRNQFFLHFFRLPAC